jgi:membrane dipeptidase
MTMSEKERPGNYDFGLNEAQEVRAESLHRDSIVIDLLSQHAGGNIFRHYPPCLQTEFKGMMQAAGGRRNGYLEAVYWPYEMSRQGKSHLLRDWYKAGGLTCGTFGVDVHDGRDPLLNKWEGIVLSYADLPWIRYVTTAAGIRQAKRDDVIACYGHCQPAAPAPRDLKAFDVAYQKGLRSFMLTYNRMDNIGVGCTERVDAGLSMFGVEVIKHCNDIGMIVDVSHCGHLTTMDACRHSKGPVNANHTAARSIHAHARCKSNEALRAIADTGGVIGVLAVPFFLSGAESPTIEHMLDHIDYIVDLVGWQHVAMGIDWPLQAPDDVLQTTLVAEINGMGFRTADHIDLRKRLVGFDDCRDLPNITRGLVKRGYGDEEIRGILGENALRVFAEVCG